MVKGQPVLDTSGTRVPDGTYQFYDFDSSNLYRYDQRGFIFKVDNGAAKYVFRFENDYGTGSSDQGVQRYSQRTMYEFSDDSPGDDMQRYIDQCEQDGSKIPAIYFVGQGTGGIPQADYNEVRSYMQSTNGYFAKVVSQSRNWAADGTAPRVFAAYLQEPRVKSKGKWKLASGVTSPGTSLPCMYVFKICSACFDSKNAIVPDLKAWYDISGKTGSQIVSLIKSALS